MPSRCCIAVCLIVQLLAAASGFINGGSLRAQVRDHDPGELLLRVRQVVARYFGADLEEITAQTDLVTDFYADPMDVVDIINILTREYGVDVQLEAERTGVEDIAAQLSRAILRAPTASPPTTRGSPSPSGASPTPGPIYRQQLFYATSRERTGDPDPNRFYGGQRATSYRLDYGICEVSIPVLAHESGREERPSRWKLEWHEDPEKHIVLQAVLPLGRERFLLALDTGLDSTSDAGARDALIFIHGFTSNFANATRRSAQMAYDLDFPGVPMLFSWPSDGSGHSYLSDREDAEWSVPHLERFVTEIVDLSGVERLHLIAHSMGNQLLIRTLHMLALKRPADAPPLLENVILAAPDFDAQLFTEQMAPRITSLAKRWTLYTSDKDLTLRASAVFGAKRLGSPLPLIEHVDTIDASGINVTPWSLPERHTYYARKQRVIADLISLLKGHGPEARDLVPRQYDGMPYWVLLRAP